MVNETLARRYAIAVFSLAGDKGAVDRVGENLQAVAAAIEDGGLTQQFFVAPVISRADKERVLTTAFGEKIDVIALHLVLLLVRKRREALLGAIVAEYRKLQLAARGEETLTVTSARELGYNELQSLVGRLERLYGRKFEIRQVIDPSVIGGVRILMGDRRVDGTVSGRLEALARTLFASN